MSPLGFLTSLGCSNICQTFDLTLKYRSNDNIGLSFTRNLKPCTILIYN